MSEKTYYAACQKVGVETCKFYLAVCSRLPFRWLREPLVKHFEAQLKEAETCRCYDAQHIPMDKDTRRCELCGGKREPQDRYRTT